jgi:hypothetical protein
MKLPSFPVLPVLSFPALVLAHGNSPHPHFNRQATPGSSSAVASSAVASSAVASSAVASSAASSSSNAIPIPSTGLVSSNGGSVMTLYPTPTGPTPSFTLVSENPTAVPLSSIVVNAPPISTSPVPLPYPVGAKPSNFPSAPGLPDSEHLTHASGERD